MRIWWCQEHGYQADEHAVNQTVEAWRRCLGVAYSEASGPYIEEEGINKGDYTPCRMVPMRLIPDNAVNRFEVIDGTGDGAGRILSKWENFKFNVGFDLQDGGRTLKIFLTNLDGETP